MGITFDKDPLVSKDRLIYDLDAWSKNPTNNFKFKT